MSRQLRHATGDDVQRRFLRKRFARESGRDCGEMKMNWLPDMDLNHDKQIQSLLCYRYTIGQAGGSKVSIGTAESRRRESGPRRWGQFIGTTALVVHRSLPPHPGPLPWGEGESFLPALKYEPLTRGAECWIWFTLSPRERAGVRGKGPRERSTLSSRLGCREKNSFASFGISESRATPGVAAQFPSPKFPSRFAGSKSHIPN